MLYFSSSDEESMVDATRATRERDNEDRIEDDLSCFEENVAASGSFVMIANNNKEEDTDKEVVDEANWNDNDEEDTNKVAPFGLLALSNWKKVNTKSYHRTYWANEVTGADIWVQPPPEVAYHKPLPKRSSLLTDFHTNRRSTPQCSTLH
jgi:hypothetical protein